MDALLARVGAREHAEAVAAHKQLAAFCERKAAAEASQYAQRYQAATRTVSVELLFYRPRKDDFLINRAVSFATREHAECADGSRETIAYAHVEICFTYDPHTLQPLQGVNYSFSIVQGGTVSLRTRTHWRSEYVAVAVPITSEQYARLYARCHALANASPPIGFDKVGMYLAPLMPARVLRERLDETHGTFCSKIIVRAFKEAGVAEAELAHLEACCCTPAKLYHCLRVHFVPTHRLGAQM